MTSTTPPRDDLQPVDWSTIEAAIYDWVQARLDNIAVIWENQLIAQPSYPYVSLLRIATVDEGGIDELRYRTLDADGLVLGEDAGAGAAATQEEQVYAPVVFTVSIKAHVGFCTGAARPSDDAIALASRLKRSLRLTSVVTSFAAAGMSVVREEQIQDISSVINGDWVSMSSLDVLFRTASVMTESVSFVEKVELRSDELGVDTVVDAS